jgi:hypothetical protein
MLLRGLSTGGILVAVLFMSLATAGRAEHMAESSQAEALTITILDQSLARSPSVRSVQIAGTPVPDIGEVNCFAEQEGSWLRFVLNQRGRDVEARVIRSGDQSTIGRQIPRFRSNGQATGRKRHSGLHHRPTEVK